VLGAVDAMEPALADPGSDASKESHGKEVASGSILPSDLTSVPPLIKSSEGSDALAVSLKFRSWADCCSDYAASLAGRHRHAPDAVDVPSIYMPRLTATPESAAHVKASEMLKALPLSSSARSPSIRMLKPSELPSLLPTSMVAYATYSRSDSSPST